MSHELINRMETNGNRHLLQGAALLLLGVVLVVISSIPLLLVSGGIALGLGGMLSYMGMAEKRMASHMRSV